MTLPEYSAQAENCPRGELYYRLRLAGMSNKAIAARYRITEPSVRGQVSEYLSKVRGGQAPMLREVKPLPAPEFFVYTGNEVPNDKIPVFAGEWRLSFDEVMIAGDLHIPSMNYPFLERMCQTADRNMSGRRTLLICGDLSNGDRDSTHDALLPSISRTQEFAMLRDAFDYLLGHFDNVLLTPGNHLRKRFNRLLQGDIGIRDLVALMTNKPDRVKMSPYDIVHIESAGEQWTVTHQYQYSRNKLITANKLAQKYRTNIITFHQHHTAVGMDEFNRHVVMDCGGLHDQNGMAYVKLVPNTMPVMNNAFVFLRRGTGHLLSPHPAFTDWGMWLGESA